MTARARVPTPAGRYWEPSPIILGIFLVFVLSRYMAWGARRQIFATIRIEFVLGAVLAALCLVIVTRRAPRLGMARDMILAIAALFATMVVAIPFAAARELAIDTFVDHVLKSALLTLYLAVLITSPRTMMVFVATFLLALFYVCQESVQGLISGGLVWWNQGIMRLHGSVPIYQHPNSLGAVALDPLPFAIFLWPALRRWWWSLALAVMATASLICIVYSGSRSAYVALIALVGWWWWRSRHKGRWLALALLVAPLLLMLVPVDYVGRFESIWGQEAAGHSKAARLQLLEDAWRIFLDHPLGVGLASFETVRLRTFGRIQDTHNLYLQLATHLGIQGVLAFVWVVVALVRAYSRVSRDLARQMHGLRQAFRGRQPSAPLRRAALSHWADLERMAAVDEAAKAFLFVHLVLGLFGHDLYFMYWWFSAGLAISLLNIAQHMRRRSEALLTMAAVESDRDGGSGEPPAVAVPGGLAR